jgi:hypothetical protein
VDEALRDRVVTAIVSCGVDASAIHHEIRYKLPTVCVSGKSIVAFSERPGSFYVMSTGVVAEIAASGVKGCRGGTIKYSTPLPDEVIDRVIRLRLGEMLGRPVVDVVPPPSPDRVPVDESRWERYDTVLVEIDGAVVVPVGFDPDVRWGSKPIHHIVGSLNGISIRGRVERFESAWGVRLGAAWLRDCPLGVGSAVQVHLAPEGPQRADLADDIVAALDASPTAGPAFDALAQFYRRDFLRWIDATKRRPEVRAERIAEMIRLLESGEKQRPR